MNSKSSQRGKRSEEFGGVFDASAVLAWLLKEQGGEVVEEALPGVISAVNLMEVVVVALRKGLPVAEVERAVSELPLEVVPFDIELVFPAAAIHQKTRNTGLSYADCIFVALAAQRNLPAFTADADVAKSSLPVTVRLIR